MATVVSLEKFCQQLGPFALIQRPIHSDPAIFDALGLPMNIAVTAPAKREEVAQGSLALLFAIDELAVTTLPPLQKKDAFSVGRQADCDLVIDDSSVSKVHALLKWDFSLQKCTIQDLGSTNGTLLNGSLSVHDEWPLRNGDIISFGHAHFWYLLSETLHARLARSHGANRLGSRSG